MRTTAPTESSVERVRRAELISWNRVELRAASSSAGQSVMVSAALGEGRGRTVEGFGAVEGDLADAGSRTRDEDRGEVGGGRLEADEGLTREAREGRASCGRAQGGQHGGLAGWTRGESRRGRADGVPRRGGRRRRGGGAVAIGV